MKLYPILETAQTYSQATDTFGGYNHTMKIPEGEFYDMENLSADHYPLMANRARRGMLSTLSTPSGMLGKSKLVYICGSSLFYDGVDITSHLTQKGLAISAQGEKTLVSMGAYLVIFPDKIYINTEQFTDCGAIDHAYSSGQALVHYSPCNAEGSPYEPIDYTFNGIEPPVSHLNTRYWLDMGKGGQKPVLKEIVWESESDNSGYEWKVVPEVYLFIYSEGIGQGFQKGDYVDISGCEHTNTRFNNALRSCLGNKKLFAVGNDFLTVQGDPVWCDQEGGPVSITRKAPDMDFVIEAGNRLWGCKYGVVDGKPINEIYGSALGDFKNWNAFGGISTDSYAASIGTDGEWTGAVKYLGHPIFFKENALHKIYISASGAHQIVDTAARGVQQGCGNSLAIVNDVLYYKARDCVCAYDGSLPVGISDKLGHEKYGNAAGGAIGDKYYISMKSASGQWSMFVYHSRNKLWHREDNTQADAFAYCGGELYFYNNTGIFAVNGTVGDLEETLSWSATTGLIGYMNTQHKYVTRFNLRMFLTKGSSADLYLEYDSNGIWKLQGHITGAGTKTFMIPVRPRRCDHFRLRIDGQGEIRLYSIAKILEIGSDEL